MQQAAEVQQEGQHPQAAPEQQQPGRRHEPEPQRFLPQALAAVLAAEAAAVARPVADSEDEEAHFVDADSGGGSGGLSLEGSAGE